MVPWTQSAFTHLCDLTYALTSGWYSSFISCVPDISQGKAQMFLPSLNSAHCFPVGLKCHSLYHSLWPITGALSSLYLVFSLISVHVFLFSERQTSRTRTLFLSSIRMIGSVQSCMHLLFSQKYMGTVIFRFLRTAVRKSSELDSKTLSQTQNSL